MFFKDKPLADWDRGFNLFFMPFCPHSFVVPAQTIMLSLGSRGKDEKARRGCCKHTKEFKVDSALLVKKHEKPVSRVALELGLNESLLRPWMQEVRETAETSR